MRLLVDISTRICTIFGRWKRWTRLLDNSLVGKKTVHL